MRSPDEHFRDIELIIQKHAAALEAEIRSQQRDDGTAQWPRAWKRLYNWRCTNLFIKQKIFRNWAADAQAWRLLPQREYPDNFNQNMRDEE